MVKKEKNSRIIKKVQQKVLEAAIELARKGEGALFVIGNNVSYSSLIKQKMQKFSVFDDGARKMLVSLATIDGAMIINSNGEVIAYGAMIKKARPVIGYGTRHAAASAASKDGNIAILCSEEERKVKIFKEGKFVLQMDALQKNIEKEIPEVTALLESVGAGLIGTIGVAALAPALGITLLPGVIIFGASYFAIKKILTWHLDEK
jgi:DNA integrity scanning protein DisA with diadenylate cyclase activity